MQNYFLKYLHNLNVLLCLQVQLATAYLEGDKYVSISGIIPTIKGLAQKFAPCEEDSRTLALFNEKVLNQLHERFEFFFGNSPFASRCSPSSLHMHIATRLDPKYKMSYFKKMEGIQVSFNLSCIN